MKIIFTVKGDPFGWQRAGQNNLTGAIYTQDKTRQHEQLIAWAYRQQCGTYRFPDKTALDLRVIAYMKVPKSASKKVRQQMLSGEIRPTVKPDYDNIGKLVSDALNGIAYDDDKCVVDGLIRKFYSDEPRTVVIIQEAQHK